MRFCILFLALLSLETFAQSIKAEGPLVLSQRKVAELVLSQGYAVQESNLRADLPRFDYATALGKYDWSFLAETGYEMSKLETFQTSLSARDERIRSKVELKKPWITGTTTSFSYGRESLQSDYFVPTTPITLPPARQTQDLFTFTIEQNLWRNSFGYGDRALVRAANENLNAAVLTRANNLQDNVLTALTKYWNAFVAEETFKEAVASRERYKKLAENVRKKTSFGFSAPGELPQIRAELESREQVAKTESTNYLQVVEDLLIYLNVGTKTPVQFEAELTIPKPPVLLKVETKDLRQFKAQELRLRAAQENSRAARSSRDPNLSLVGQFYSSGVEEKPNDATAEAFSGVRPKYYVGLKFEVPFGSDLQNETYVNRQILLKLEEINRDRLLLTVDANLADQERRVQSLHSVVTSLEEEKTQREKAMQEINRAYTQGRIDIRQTIESLNNFFNVKIKYSRAVGDYQIALAKLASLRDELIPSPKAGRP